MQQTWRSAAHFPIAKMAAEPREHRQYQPTISFAPNQSRQASENVETVASPRRRVPAFSNTMSDSGPQFVHRGASNKGAFSCKGAVKTRPPRYSSVPVCTGTIVRGRFLLVKPLSAPEISRADSISQPARRGSIASLPFSSFACQSP